MPNIFESEMEVLIGLEKTRRRKLSNVICMLRCLSRGARARWLTGAGVTFTSLYVVHDQRAPVLGSLILTKSHSPKVANPTATPTIKMPSVRAAVVKQIQQNRVMIFCKTDCWECDRAKEVLNAAKIEYHSVNLDQLKDNKDLGHLSGRAIQNFIAKQWGIKTVPAIFVNQELLGGNEDLQDLVKTGDFEHVFCDW